MERIPLDMTEKRHQIGSVHGNDDIMNPYFFQQGIKPDMIGLRLLTAPAPQSSCALLYGMGDPHMQGAIISPA